MSSATSQKTSPGSAINAVSGGTYAEQLARLEAQAEAASVRVDEARRIFRTEGSAAAQEVTAELTAYADAIAFRKGDATPEEERPVRERELTDRLLYAVRDRGLVIHPAANGTFRITDPSLQREFTEAMSEQRDANNAVEAFKADHAPDLEKERKAADATRIKDALDGDDGDRIREALVPSVAPGSGAFTTADLPPRQRVTSAG